MTNLQDDNTPENTEVDTDVTVLDETIEEVVEEKKSKGKKTVDVYIKNIVETLLFVNEKPVTIEQFKRVIDTANASEIKLALQELIKDYDERDGGMVVVELAGGYQMRTNPHYASYVKDFYKTKHKEKLSKPALETLAIIAYKQPVTRADIELIRGVNSDGVVVHLINKELLKVVGRKDVPGRPFMYGTTKQFLEYFGLKSLDNLPKLEEFPSLIEDDDKEIVDEEVTFVQQEIPKEAKDQFEIDPETGLEVERSEAESTEGEAEEGAEQTVAEHIEQEQLSEIEEIEQEAAEELERQEEKKD